MKTWIYLWFISALLAACTTISQPSQPKRLILPVIDVHSHLDFDGTKEESSGILISEQEYLRERKAANIVAGVHLTGQEGRGFRDLSQHNVIRCYGVGKVPKQAVLEREIQSKDYRCLKIYLGYVHQFASDPNYKPVYQVARKYHIPVIFHTGDTYSSKGKLKYSDPMGVDEVAADYPDVTFVIAHLGNPWIQTAAEIAYNKPNVYVEASALLIGKLEENDPESINTYLLEPISWAFHYIENPQKFLFGTDWPLVSMPAYLEAYKKAIPKKHWCDVFYRNALKVFKFPAAAQNLPCEVD